MHFEIYTSGLQEITIASYDSWIKLHTLTVAIKGYTRINVLQISKQFQLLAMQNIWLLWNKLYNRIVNIGSKASIS